MGVGMRGAVGRACGIMYSKLCNTRTSAGSGRSAREEMWTEVPT